MPDMAQEVATRREGAGFTPVGEEAVVAEADKAGRQDMEEAAAEESMGVHFTMHETTLHVFRIPVVSRSSGRFRLRVWGN
jgi:hypothetical protein